MSNETLKAFTDFFCSGTETTEFIWHGGEPLLAGLNLYQSAVKYQKRWITSGRRVTNFVQTNATLINDEWAKFFSDNGFSVGVSIDAPSHVHNHTRRFKNGKPSLEGTLRETEILKKAGVLNGAICCVSSANWRQAAAVLKFFISHGIKKLKFLRVKGPFEEAISKKQYVSFLINIFKTWLAMDDPEIEIRDIKSLLDVMLGGNFRECVHMGRCDKFATIYSDGAVYPCDNLPQSTSFYFGNVKDGREAVGRSRNFTALLKMLEQRKDHCSSCDWFNVCRGGCLSEYIQANQQRKEGAWCEDLKKMFGEIKDALKKYRLV